MVTTITKRSNTRKGPTVATMICQPAKERPKNKAGRRKNTTSMYTTANQRYLAVMLPSFLAVEIGTFLVAGTAYQRQIPDKLKKRWQRAICSDKYSLLPSLASEAKMAVKVVPMLDPRVRG